MQHVDTLSRDVKADDYEDKLATHNTVHINTITGTRSTNNNETAVDTTTTRRDEKYVKLKTAQEHDEELQNFKNFNKLEECNGLWMFQGRIFTPKEWRKDLMTRYHYAPWGAHPGSSKLLKKLSRHYFWPNMRHE